MLTIWDLWKS